MSENIPESIPTSSDSKSRRPVKKARRDTPGGAQASAVDALFKKQPDIDIPVSATKAPKTTANLPPPPEIVTNVQGSSAGAGSGEFHVYKASRRRDYERIRLMEEEARREEELKEWEEKQKQAKEKDESKTSKNRKRRDKKKANMEKTKGVKAGGDEKETNGVGVVKKIKPLDIRRTDDGDDGDDGAVAKHELVNNAGGEENGIVMHDDD